MVYLLVYLMSVFKHSLVDWSICIINFNYIYSSYIFWILIVSHRDINQYNLARWLPPRKMVVLGMVQHVGSATLHIPGLVNIQKAIENGHRNSGFSQL